MVTEKIHKFFLFATEFFKDAKIYLRYCGISPLQDKKIKSYYKTIIEAHTIEKGLSLQNPRKLFGRQKINFVMHQVREHGVNSNEMPIQMAAGALKTYLDFHKSSGIIDPLLNDIEKLLNERKKSTGTIESGGLRVFTEKINEPNLHGINLLKSRFSCRIFSNKKIEENLIKEITALALTAPSQCNRQSTKVHYFDNPAQVLDLLKLQAGSAGFADQVPSVVVISFDIAAWGGAQQRNQGYVDASLFSMNFMLAAHALGIASCPLNLAVQHTTEEKIKIVGRIPVDQRLVMMIALGYPAPGAIKAAASPRRSAEEILSISH